MAKVVGKCSNFEATLESCVLAQGTCRTFVLALKNVPSNKIGKLLRLLRAGLILIHFLVVRNQMQHESIGFSI